MVDAAWEKVGGAALIVAGTLFCVLFTRRRAGSAAALAVLAVFLGLLVIDGASTSASATNDMLWAVVALAAGLMLGWALARADKENKIGKSIRKD